MDAPRPGLVAHLGMVQTAGGPDGVVMACTPTADHANGAGFVHGGFLAALLDTATGRAVDAVLPDGDVPPHLALAVQYLRVAHVGAPLTCRARVVRAGRRTAFAEAEVHDAEGRLVASAASTHAVVTLRED